MENQRNLILAIALSVAILVGFQIFFEKPKPIAPPDAATTQSTSQAPAGQAPIGGTAPAPGAASTGALPLLPGTPATVTPAATRAAALADQPRVKIDTPTLHGSIALKGGRIDDMTLVRYRETVDPTSPEIVLLSPVNAPHPYFAEFGWTVPPADKATKLPDGETLWTADGAALSPKTPVTLSWDNGAGLQFRRVFSIDENYLVTVRQTVENKSTAPVTLLPYGVISRTGKPETLGYYILHEGPLGVFNGVLQEKNYADLLKAVEFKSTGGWLGITDKYWLTALIPDQKEAVATRMINVPRDKIDRFQTDFVGSERVVAPGATAESTSRFFGGPKEVNLLTRYRDELGIDNFDLAIDFGWFYWLTKPIFFALQYLHGVLGNFGLAILVLTVAIKLVFFPLANKSYVAMSKMKLLQPKMLELREKYGDDKAKLNQEMMALYKTAGANPLAGCLPIVIQIPVFFSLYKVLFVTIEMRHAPFYGWIHDLSAQDPTTIFNLFGLIPWTPPAVLMIGGWPLIMGVTMYLQQKLNPQPADPVQAKMFMFLPFVFTYMLASFPAGLVIYWAWNNTLSVAQQWLIMRQNKAI